PVSILVRLFRLERSNRFFINLGNVSALGGWLLVAFDAVVDRLFEALAVVFEHTGIRGLRRSRLIQEAKKDDDTGDQNNQEQGGCGEQTIRPAPQPYFPAVHIRRGSTVWETKRVVLRAVAGQRHTSR